MDQFYKQDVFFFVTTIAVIVITILLAVLIVYVVGILRDIKYIAKRAKTETDLLSEDLEELRQNVKVQGFKVKHAVSFFSSFLNRRKK